VDGVRYLGDVFSELGGPRRIFYFGDLDPQGLLIPQEASSRAQGAGWPAIEAHEGVIVNCWCSLLGADNLGKANQLHPRSAIGWGIALIPSASFSAPGRD
jgi:hypothetical protein